MKKTPAHRLSARARKRESEIVANFMATAKAAGMTPEQLAAQVVFIYADMGVVAVRKMAFDINPSVSATDGRLMFAADRALILRTSPPDGLRAAVSAALPKGHFNLLCVAGTIGDAMVSWTLSPEASPHSERSQQAEDGAKVLLLA
jgi:hypothetical protein